MLDVNGTAVMWRNQTHTFSQTDRKHVTFSQSNSTLWIFIYLFIFLSKVFILIPLAGNAEIEPSGVIHDLVLFHAGPWRWSDGLSEYEMVFNQSK